MTISTGDGNDECFADRVVIYRDGNSSNFSDENVITREWFYENYSYEDFLDDYGLIHRQQSSYLKVFEFLTGEHGPNAYRLHLERLQAQFNDLSTKYTQATLLLAEHGISVNKRSAPKSVRPKRSTTRK